MTLKIVTIKAVDGSVLYEGRAKSKKQLIEALVREGCSLAYADLTGQDLSYLDLTDVDFRGAVLRKAVLRGAKVDDGQFYGADLSGALCEGMSAKRADFSRIDAKPFEGQSTTFAGATLTHSRFEGADIEGACFDGCGMSGMSFTLATILRSSFRRSRVLNVDHAHARYLDCDFTEADLAASGSLTRRIPEKALPDRTRGTIAVGNRYDGARLDETTPAFRADRAIRKITAVLTWTATTGAILGAAAMLPLEPDAALADHLGAGGGFVAVIGAVALMKARIEDVIKDFATEKLLRIQMEVRRGVSELSRRGGNVIETVAAFAFGQSRIALRRALSATEGHAMRNGWGPMLRQLATGHVDVILADRRHMAKALEWISTAINRDREDERDLVVIRVGGGREAPTAMTYFAGGGSVAVWARDGRIARTMVWTDGMTDAATAQERRTPKRVASLARKAFETAIVQDHHPEAKLDFDRKTHQLRAGGDGSVVVTRRQDQLPDNPMGPVVIQPSGVMLDGKTARAIAIAEDAFAEEAEHDLVRAGMAP